MSGSNEIWKIWQNGAAMIYDSLIQKIRSWLGSRQRVRMISDPRDLSDLPKGAIVIAGTRITVIEPARARDEG